MSATTQDAPAPAATPFSIRNPYQATRLDNIRLTGPESEKDTRHHVIDLGDSGISYEPGDALGLIARNCPDLVSDLIAALGATGKEAVPDRNKNPKPLAAALLEDYAISLIDKKFVEACIKKGASELAPLLEPENSDRLKAFLTGADECWDYVDVLRAHPNVKFDAQEFVTLLRRMPPRLYSIASALSAHPGQVHLTVATVRYPIRGRLRKGVVSTFLAERWKAGEETAGIYIQNQQKHFSLPHDPSTPVVMVGPGTGIAPFRAFLAHRLTTGATGKHWLFFGERRSSQDFFYKEALEKLEQDGHVRLSLAWSRDVPGQRTFVQTRMLEAGKEVWEWIDNGADFFVCGDKARMAADVDAALHTIVRDHGGKSEDEAKEYVAAMKKAHRYKRDVY